METNLHVGEYVLVDKTRYLWAKPKRGDVITIRQPQDEHHVYIKRLTGLQGDTIEVSRGRVCINGHILDEPYVNGPTIGTLPAHRLGADEYFVMGDNRLASKDSRNFGAIHLHDIVGQAGDHLLATPR